jgi:hypothetical protein
VDFIRATRKAPVAQLDRAPDYESGGQEFESLRARHYLIDGVAAIERNTGVVYHDGSCRSLACLPDGKCGNFLVGPAEPPLCATIKASVVQTVRYRSSSVQ